MTNVYDFWTDEVDKAVSAYVSDVDTKEKNKVFDKYLYNAFNQLINITLKQYNINWNGIDEREIKSQILFELIMNLSKFNPDKIRSNGDKVCVRMYCQSLIRSAIKDYHNKTFRESQNVRFDESHEILLHKIS